MGSIIQSQLQIFTLRWMKIYVMVVKFVLTVAIFDIDVVAGVVLAAFFRYGKKNWVVIDFGAKLVVPFLHKQHAGFCSGMRFEGVAV